jgi:hypothetical protein
MCKALLKRLTPFGCSDYTYTTVGLDYSTCLPLKKIIEYVLCIRPDPDHFGGSGSGRAGQDPDPNMK